jgi:hypothetical protein
MFVIYLEVIVWYCTGCWDVFIFNRDKRFFSSPELPGRLWGTLNPLLSGYRGSFPGVRRPCRQVHHSPTSIADVKNEWSYTFIFPISLRGMDVENVTSYIRKREAVLYVCRDITGGPIQMTSQRE